MAPNYYVVKVHGEYFADSGQRKELRGYRTSFKLPDASQPLGVIKGKLLMPYLRKRDPQAFAVYTHFIDSISSSDGKPLDPDEVPYRFQTKEQLRAYVKRHRLPLNVDEYGDLGLLRDHVRIAKEEPEYYKIVAAKYAKRSAEEKALFDLNKDTFEEGEVNIPLDVAAGGSGNMGDAEKEPETLLT